MRNARSPARIEHGKTLGDAHDLPAGIGDADAAAPLLDPPAHAPRHEYEGDALHVPLIHDDEEVTEFSVPQFVQDPEDIRGVALLVVGAWDKWQSVKGLGG